MSKTLWLEIGKARFNKDSMNTVCTCHEEIINHSYPITVTKSMLKTAWQESETPILSKCDQTYSNITSQIPPAKQETDFSTAFLQVVKGRGPSSKSLDVIPLALLRLH